MAATLAINTEDWLKPPKTASGDPIWVDLRVNIRKVSAIDTVAGSADVALEYILYWTDSRLVDYLGADLPPNLWGPRLKLKNVVGAVDESQNQFFLVDNKTGRLKRSFAVSATVVNTMQLQDFPFDLDSIEVSFETSSAWSSYDCTQAQIVPRGKTYRLRKVCEHGEGKWIDLIWNAEVNEWSVHGISTQIEELPPRAHGEETTVLHIDFHISRKASYYFWKALFPLYLLTFLSFSTFQFDTDDKAERTATVATYFLAAFAMLYVVGSALPKTDYLTKIDSVIVMTTISLAFIGGASQVLAYVHKVAGAEVADFYNAILWIATPSVYVLGNIVIFLPPFVRQRRSVSRLTRKCRRGSDKAADLEASHEAHADVLPTVNSDFDYFTIATLQAMRMPAKQTSHCTGEFESVTRTQL